MFIDFYVLSCVRAIFREGLIYADLGAANRTWDSVYFFCIDSDCSAGFVYFGRILGYGVIFDDFVVYSGHFISYYDWHLLPVFGEYTWTDYLLGLSCREIIEQRVDGRRLALVDWVLARDLFMVGYRRLVTIFVYVYYVSVRVLIVDFSYCVGGESILDVFDSRDSVARQIFREYIITVQVRYRFGTIDYVLGAWFDISLLYVRDSSIDFCRDRYNGFDS